MSNGQNDFRFDDLVGKMKELGDQAGKGKDTQIKFGLLVLNASYDGTIDDVKDKHGRGVDDVTKLCSEYARAQSKATMFDAKSASSRVQMAKANVCRKLGAWTRGGPGEPIATVDKLLAMRGQLRQDPNNAKLLDDAYSTLLRYARFQLRPSNVSTLVSDEELLRSFCYKPTHDTKTHEEVIQGIIKTLEDVRAGRAASGTVQDACPQIQDAVAGLKVRLGELRGAATAAVTPPVVEAALPDDDEILIQTQLPVPPMDNAAIDAQMNDKLAAMGIEVDADDEEEAGGVLEQFIADPE